MNFFRVFRNRNLCLLTAADSVSVLGDQMGWIAILWFATVTTKNSAMVGLLGLVFGVPGVALGAVVGNVLDRAPQKRIVGATNVLLGVIFTLIPLLYHLGWLPFALLVGLVFLAGCLTPFTSVGWMTLLPAVVSEDELGAANSANETAWHGASLLGPVLGGLLIARFGSPVAILIDGVTYWLAALFILWIRMPGTAQQRATTCDEQPATPVPTSFWRETAAGFRILYQLKPVWWITIGALILNLAYGQLEVSLPLLTHGELHASADILGLLWTTYFIASLIGAAVGGWLTTRGKPGVWLAGMAVAGASALCHSYVRPPFG